MDTLSPKSVMVIAHGALSGSPAFFTARFVVGVRSPLTGIFGDANGGGFWGAHLRRAGFSVVIIRGRVEKPVYLKIEDQQDWPSRREPGVVMGVCKFPYTYYTDMTAGWPQATKSSCFRPRRVANPCICKQG